MEQVFLPITEGGVFDVHLSIGMDDSYIHPCYKEWEAKEGYVIYFPETISTDGAHMMTKPWSLERPLVITEVPTQVWAEFTSLRHKHLDDARDKEIQSSFPFYHFWEWREWTCVGLAVAGLLGLGILARLSLRRRRPVTA